MRNFAARAASIILGFWLPAAKAQSTFTTLISFDGTNGASPRAGLAQGLDGNFYGTSEAGGSGMSRGTIFKVTPSGELTNLLAFIFPYTNGADPQAALLQASDGNLYGVTSAGGAYSQGTIFRLTAAGALSVLYSFIGSFDGAHPWGALTQGSDGSLYGTTPDGGFYGNGTVFQIKPDGTFQDLYSFSDGDGVNPYARLVQGVNGNFFGTTEYGGIGYDGTAYSGYGTVFAISTNGVLSTLTAFTGNGAVHPYAGVIQGFDGNLYGTTREPGTNGNCGTLFKLSINGVLTSLARFVGTNGASPTGDLVQGFDGNLYGTTSAGGIGYNGSPSTGFGTLFRITTNGALTTLVWFNGTNGRAPMGALMQGSDGYLYGTTSAGGLYDSGTVFRLTLPPPPPVFRTVSQSAGRLFLTSSAIQGHTYQVQYSTNLPAANWTDLMGPVVATNTTITVSDRIGPDSRRFYRVLLLP